MKDANHKIKVNEELLRQYLEEEWKKLWNSPDLALQHAGKTVVDVLKDETKGVVEKVLKRFRP